MNLAANAMVNGVCCFYEMKQESKRQEDQEKAIRNVFRTELDDLVLASNSSDTDESKSKNKSSVKNTSSDNSNNSNAKEHKATRSRDKLVRAYKDAFLSCSSKHQEEQQESSSSLPSTAPLQDDGVPQYQDVYSPPRSLHIFERDQPPLQQQQQHQQQQQSSQSYSYAPSSHRGNLFPIGIPARHQSFSRVKRFDNAYQLDSNNKDNVLDLFLYSSSSSCSSSTVSRHSQPKQQHPSLVNGYNLRNKRSPLLPPIRIGSSLLEEMSENNSEYDDHDWLDGSSSRRSHHTESNNNSSNNKDLRKELVWSNDVDSFESVRIE